MTKIPENSIRTKSYWWHWPLTLFFVAIFISLGFWQLHRAEVKQALEQDYKARFNAPAISLSQLPTLGSDIQFYLVKITGHYDPKYSFYLDNKTHKGQAGYEIITLFHPENKQQAILINRGWIPAGANRQELPKINTPAHTVTIEGVIYQPNKKPFLLSHKEEAQNTWPQRVQSLDLAKISQTLKQPIYSFTVLLAENNAGVFAHNWQPVTMPSYKHMGYAVQWFLIALTLLIIVIVLKRRSKKYERKTAKNA